ncbi:MAG: isoprenylcysteine carboxylmethyltransferase family protein [Cyclobacteriaceae bacterium]
MNIYQILLPVSTLLYFLLIFVIRSFIHWRQTGVNPFVFGKSEGAHDYIGKIYKVLFATSWIMIALFSFGNKWYQLLLPIYYLEYDVLKQGGVILLFVSLVYTSLAQYEMSGSWRIGINYEEKTSLIQTGAFRYSRNPIFLGIQISYIGMFLVAPNVLSFTLLVTMFLCFQIQVRLEESYLLDKHGEEYHEYYKRVPRWLIFK